MCPPDAAPSFFSSSHRPRNLSLFSLHVFSPCTCPAPARPPPHARTSRTGTGRLDGVGADSPSWLCVCLRGRRERERAREKKVDVGGREKRLGCGPSLSAGPLPGCPDASPSLANASSCMLSAISRVGGVRGGGLAGARGVGKQTSPTPRLVCLESAQGRAGLSSRAPPRRPPPRPPHSPTMAH